MKKKFIIIITCFILLLVCLGYKYSTLEKLNKAIRDGKCQEAQRIIEINPWAVNCNIISNSETIRTFMDVGMSYPITIACKNGDYEMIQLLVEHNANVNITDCGMTPLGIVYAFKLPGWYEMSEYLINQGADINYNKGNHAILVEIMDNRFEMPESDNQQDIEKAFSYIVENMDTSQVDWNNIAWFSVNNERKGLVEYIFSNYDVDVNDLGKNENNVIVVMMRRIAKKNEDIKNGERNAVIQEMVSKERSQCVEILKFLLAQNVDENKFIDNGKSLMEYAYEFGDQEVIELLSK